MYVTRAQNADVRVWANGVEVTNDCSEAEVAIDREGGKV